MTPYEILKLMEQLLSLDAYGAEQLLKQHNLNYGFDDTNDVINVGVAFLSLITDYSNI